MTQQTAIVLGAGISGMTIAEGLVDRGYAVTILDAYERPGGNHLSWTVGPYTFDIGTIYFPQHSPVAELVPNIADLWVEAEHTVERITPSGTVQAYPLSLRNELLARSPFYIATVGAQILRQKLRLRAPETVHQFVRYYIGERLLQDSGLLLFMQRFYNLPIDQVGFSLAKRRMAWISDHAGLRMQARKAWTRIGRLLRGRVTAEPDNWFARAWYVRPKAGFSAMYTPAAERLRTKGVAIRLGENFKSIARSADGFEIVTDGGSLSAARLVSTIPLEIVSPLIGLPVDDLPRSSPLLTLCLRFRGKRGFGAEVLYNFHRNGAWKRLTMHSDFYGKADGWEYLAVEITLQQDAVDAEAQFAAFRAMTRGVGLFDGELEMVDHHVTRFAYPVYDAGSEAKRTAALGALHALGVETVGRQGSFEYVPVATEAMAAARTHLATEIRSAA